MPFLWFVLLVDDAIAIFAITFLGLNFHQMDAALFERLPFTAIPYFVAWAIAAAALRLYNPEIATKPAQLWRVLVAAVVASLPAAALRSLWLGTPLVPIFVVVMGGIVAVGLLVTRSIFALIFGMALTKNE
jgi:hypothetical protein